MESPILGEFSRNYGLYQDFTQKLNGLLAELLERKGIRVHSITSRTKDPKSLAGKLNRSSGKYTALEQITDLVGVRVITYYNDEVDAIAEVMEQEFDLDLSNSVDKRELLDPDQFGYLSLHYVAKLSPQRLALAEYERFKDCKFEVQIRSILQHTWAEIEHDLGYKSKQAIPKDVRRSFSRLAGLLELADMEFAKIRDQLTKYEQDMPKQIHEQPTQVLIDQASLKSYLNTNPLVEELDRHIAAMAGVQIIHNEQFIGGMVEKLSYLGQLTISDVDLLLNRYRDTILEFAKHVLAQNRVGDVTVGICLFYLCNVLIGSTGSLDRVREYLRSNYIGNEASNEALARDILMYYQLAAVK